MRSASAQVAAPPGGVSSRSGATGVTVELELRVGRRVGNAQLEGERIAVAEAVGESLSREVASHLQRCRDLLLLRARTLRHVDEQIGRDGADAEVAACRVERGRRGARLHRPDEHQARRSRHVLAAHDERVARARQRHAKRQQRRRGLRRAR